MQNSSKNSRETSSNNKIFYWASIFLAVFSVALLVWFYWPDKPNFEPAPAEIKKEREGLNLEQLDDLPRKNRRKIEVIERKLASNYNPDLKAKNKAQIEEELRRVKRLSNNIDQVELSVRLKKINDSIVSVKIVQLQIEKQNQFTISSQEEGEAKHMINELMVTFFRRFREKILTKEPEKYDLQVIEPEFVKGKRTDANNYREHVAYCKKRFSVGDDTVRFLGFAGWLNSEDKAETSRKEGKSLFGLSLYDKNVEPLGQCTVAAGKSVLKKKISGSEKIFWDNNDPTLSVCHTHHRPLVIKLLKEFLFSREGNNDEWITDFKKKGDKVLWSWNDISYEQLIDTIAHELAHSVLSSIMKNYDEYEKNNSGKGDGEGHGPLHTRYTREIEDMIHNSSEGKAFEKWWNKKKTNGEN